jgi:nitronate monooxygenase
VSAFTERLGLERPLIQAGMGGGLPRHELAAAVSSAGGLGTIGFLSPEDLRKEIAAARRETDRPLAVNLLLPFARKAHFDAASMADVVVTFWGRPRRQVATIWVHQCGSVEEALEAQVAGADAVIAQGIEAGGHVRGTIPATELLAAVRRAVGDGYPVLSAGGIADAADVRSRLEAGADAVVCGTRFLMSEESRAHPEYKARLLSAERTVLTQLFGAGWPAPHRVVENRATQRWLRDDPRGPRWVRDLQRASAPLLARMPMGWQAKLAASQTSDRPLFSPIAATKGGPSTLIEAGPLYAGECVERIADIRPAGELVRELAP